MELVVLRYLPILPIFMLIAAVRLRRKRVSLDRRDLLTLVLLGFVGVIGYNISLNTGQTRIPASLAAFIIALNPASIAIIAALWLGEVPPARTWFGLLIGLGGIAVIVFGREALPEVRSSMLTGVLITLGAPLSWGIYTSGLRKLSPKFGALTITALTMSFGSLPLIFFITPSVERQVAGAPTPLIVAVLFLSIACTVYGFTGFARVVKTLPAAKAGAFIYLVPLIAAVGSNLILNEPIDAPLVTGGLIVLAGIYLASGKTALLKSSDKAGVNRTES